MKIEEQNPYVSTSPVAMEALYAHYEARGVFGKRNFFPSFHVFTPYNYLRIIWFGMYKTLELAEARLGLEILN